MIFTRPTGTPTLRAALGSPPTAKIQLPKRVLRRTQVASAVSPIHQRTETGRPGTTGTPSGRTPDHADLGEPAEDAAEGVAGEKADDPAVFAALRDVGDLRPPGDPARHRQRQSAQDEEERERDDEGRQAGADEEQPVDVADEHGEGEGDQHRRDRAAGGTR